MKIPPSNKSNLKYFCTTISLTQISSIHLKLWHIKKLKKCQQRIHFFLISLNKHTGILLHFTYYWDSLKLCYIKSHIKIYSLWPSTISLRKKWNDYICWVVVLGVWHPFWTVCSKGSYEDTPEAKGHENCVNCFVSCFYVKKW